MVMVVEWKTFSVFFSLVFAFILNYFFFCFFGINRKQNLLRKSAENK